jgi:uncharacterized protein (TIGR03086 family)
MADQTLDLIRRSLDEFGGRVAGISDDKWTAPTPCDDWDVRALVRHLVYECVWMPPLYEGQTVEQVGDRYEGDLLGDDPKKAWADAARAALETVSAPGALEKTVALSMGPTSGKDYARQILTDLTIHAWDLARAIGADERLDAGLVTEIATNPPYDIDGGRAAGYFGPTPETSTDADAQTKLLARFGRKA